MDLWWSSTGYRYVRIVYQHLHIHNLFHFISSPPLLGGCVSNWLLGVTRDVFHKGIFFPALRDPCALA